MGLKTQTKRTLNQIPCRPICISKALPRSQWVRVFVLFSFFFFSFLGSGGGKGTLFHVNLLVHNPGTVCHVGKLSLSLPHTRGLLSFLPF